MSAEEKKIKSLRILALDYLRGLYILIMIVTHAICFWPKPEAIWLFAYEGPLIGSIAACGYVFVSGIGFGFSWTKVDSSGVSPKEQNLRSFSHSMALYVIALGFNLGSSFSATEQGFGIFSWTILQCLVFSRLLSQIFIKLKKNYRFLTALGLIAISSIVLNLIDFGYSDNLFHKVLFVLFYIPLSSYPFIVYFPFFLIGTIIGEDLYKGFKDPIKARILVKQWFFIGSCLVGLGVLLGLQLETITPYNGRDIFFFLHANPAVLLTEYPIVLDPNSYAWCLAACGINIILLMSLVCFLDLNAGRHEKTRIANKNLFFLFGKYSLTIYLGHYLAFLLPLLLDVYLIWVAAFLLVFIVYLLILKLDKRGKGKYSLEFVIGIIGEVLYRKLAHHGKGKDKRLPD